MAQLPRQSTTPAIENVWLLDIQLRSSQAWPISEERLQEILDIERQARATLSGAALETVLSKVAAIKAKAAEEPTSAELAAERERLERGLVNVAMVPEQFRDSYRRKVRERLDQIAAHGNGLS